MYIDILVSGHTAPWLHLPTLDVPLPHPFCAQVAGRMSGVLASVQGLNPISYQIVRASNSPTLNSSQASALRSASSMLNSSVLSVVGGPTINVQDLNNSINKAFDSSKTTDDMFNQYSKIVIQVSRSKAGTRST